MDTIELAGKQYKIVKKGAAQAEQVALILKWLSKYAKSITEQITDTEGKISFGNSIFDLINILSTLATPQALVELFEVVIGCSKKVAEEEFDLAIMIDALEVMFANESYKRVVNRFFSTK